MILMPKMKIVDGVRYRPEDLETFGLVTRKAVATPAAARQAKADAEAKAAAEADEEGNEDDGSGEQGGSGTASGDNGGRPKRRPRASQSK